MKSYLYLAYEALRHQIGISVPTSDPQRLRTLLYKEREGIPELSSLEFRLSPSNPDGELWITHRPAKASTSDTKKANSRED